MTDTELHKLLSELRALPGETEIVEFKEAKRDFSFEKLGKYFSALSNEANLKSKPEAWLVFGIENKKRAIVGSDYRNGNRLELDSLKGEMANKTTNRITFIEIYEVNEPEGRVILFQIPAAPIGLPIAWEGHYYGRDGEALSPLNLEEIERIRRHGIVTDWSAAICHDATIADIDWEKVDNFVHIAQAKRGFPIKPGTSAKKVLGHLQLMYGDKVTNGALLAFGKKPQRYFTTAITKCAQFHGFVVEKPIPDHKVFHGDVFEQVDNAVNFVLSKISVSVGRRDKSVQAPIQYEIPKDVVTEAIVNAIAHREYNSNASVQVMLFVDRLEIWNPGSLTPALNIKKLKTHHPSFPKNPKLAEALYQAGYIERFGTGTEEIFKLTKAAGLKEPVFDLTSGFSITIWRKATPQVPDKYPASTGQVQDKYRTSTAQAPHKYRTSQEIERLVLAMEGEMKGLKLQESLELKHRVSFLKNYLQPAINEGFIELTVPEKPKSPKQSYRLTTSGLELQTILRSK